MPYPDLLNAPQLLTASSCYLGRYPPIRDRPNPYVREPLPDLRRAAKIWMKRITRILDGEEDMDSVLPETYQSVSNSISVELPNEKGSLKEWLEESTFQKMTSHHPLYSPSTDPNHPFVKEVMSRLAGRTRFLFHHGSAEWFAEPSRALARVAKDAGVDVIVQEEYGGLHVESCLLPGELGGSAGRLVSGIIKFLESKEPLKN
jgi:hypothetical protein